MVSGIWHFCAGAGDNATIPCRGYGRYSCCPSIGKADSHCNFVDGNLGILDCACSPDRWRTDMGLYRARGKLGSTTCPIFTHGLAKQLEAVVQQIKFVAVLSQITWSPTTTKRKKKSTGW